MSRLGIVCSTAVLIVFAANVSHLGADRRGVTLVVTMTNDLTTNQIKVYDAETRGLIQTLSTRGKGGVGGNARGVTKQTANSSRR